MNDIDRTAEAALRESQERQAFLLKLSDALRPLAGALDIQREASRLLRQELGADRVTYWEVIERERAAHALAEDAQHDLPSLVGGRSSFEDFEQRETESLRRGDPAGHEDVQAGESLSPQQKACFAGKRINALMRMPLVKSGRLVAYLAAYFETAHYWTPRDVDFLRETAEWTWAAVERAHAEAALRESEAKLALELADARELQRVSALLIQVGGVHAVYERILDAARALVHSDTASIQMLVPERDALFLLAEKGLAPESAKFWEWVRADHTTACGLAFARHEPVIVPDVEDWDFVAGTEDLTHYRMCRIRAMLSMPLFSRDGHLVGVISTHWHDTHRPSERELQLLDVLARQAADLIERHAVEEALRASEQKYRSLADAVPQLIWANDGAGQANYFNRRWYDYTGLSFEESFGPGWQAVVHPDDAPTSVENWRRALAAGQVFDSEYRLRGADGSYRWFIGRNVPVRDAHDRITGWFGTATDIEDLKHAEQALRESQERLRLMLENAREYAIFSMDLWRRITSWNTGAETMLGYREEEAIGNSGDIIFTPEDRANGAPDVEAAKALAEGRAADERWHVRKDGSRFWGSGVMTAMRDSKGNAFGLLKIFRDQTTERYIKEALDESRKRMVEALHEAEQARAEAEAAGQAKDQFLAVLSHELRTPLTPVMLATRMLDKRSDLPPAVRETIAMIRRNIELEAHFVDDLLDVTRIARGKMELATSPMDIHDAVLRAVEITHGDIEAKGLTLDVKLEAQRHDVNGDAARLQQVFWNLLKNAAKFTPHGGRIFVRSRNESNFVVVEVQDTGIGIEPAVLPQLFEPFTQADVAITRQFGGLGLGLAIAKATVQGHGGEIRASSEGTNRGATFVVSLPLNAAG